ncbi:MAG: hypothetical protein WCF36_15630 [Candidatus Nanopelagicales bacterium]
MYFLLADLTHRFIYLKLGLGLVLVWVGIKLVLQVDLYKMPTWLSLGVVATIITVAIVASLRATRGQPAAPHGPEVDTVTDASTAPGTDVISDASTAAEAGTTHEETQSGKESVHG